MDLARSLPSDKRRQHRQAKDAERLEPKGTVAGTEVLPSPVMDRQRSRRIESTSPMRVNLVERGKPVSFLSQKGREAVRPTNGGAGRGVGKSEGRPVTGRIRVVTSPGAKARRLPCGVSAREPERNRYRRCGK